MKKLITAIIAAIAVSPSALADRLFPYPEIPDSIDNLYERSNYFVTHFWDKCDIKTAMKSPERLDSAFRDYISLMPHATADTVFTAIDRLYTSIGKNPEAVVAIGRMAEAGLYDDTAEYWSDELYLRFIKPVIDNKKVKATDKMRFEHQARILSKSQEGMTAPDLSYTTRTGQKHDLKDHTGEFTILFFNDPGCDECSMMKLRLDADVKATEMQQNGRLKIISITPGEADADWKAAVDTYPAQWEVGAAPDADSIYDLRRTPNLYFLDHNRRILAKNLSLDVLLRTLGGLK
ncbi:MAG: DUF5106 domain-containing protein [Pseudoflavonifractor sp.]|nr:DUF5106 domain-containing protein [Pseudoflavonifractor sp.]